MQIEVGESYEIRDGRKAFIQYTDHELAIGCLVGGFSHYYWRLDGKSTSDNASHTDIISKWSN